MALLPFTRSERFTLGTELELQVIDKNNNKLSDKADIILADMTASKQQVKHELTRSMIELNSSVHSSVKTLYNELSCLTCSVREVAWKHECEISGGGRHPDGDWREQVISDLQHYQHLADRYGYITKMACVFGLHVHIGVRDGNEAIYLCHALLPYLPHLIALSASSPWLDGVDTCFASSRFTGQNAFMNSELPENVYNWNEFTVFYNELVDAKVIKNIRDIYWYVRPQPALGTVEIRICDMPLTVYHAAMLAGYCKILVRYLLNKRQRIVRKHHAVEKYNIFNARRDGLQASYTNILTRQRQPLAEHILQILKLLSGSACEEDDRVVLQYVENYVITGITDSDWIRGMIRHAMDLGEVTDLMINMLLSAPERENRVCPLPEYHETK